MLGDCLLILEVLRQNCNLKSALLYLGSWGLAAQCTLSWNSSPWQHIRASPKLSHVAPSACSWAFLLAISWVLQQHQGFQWPEPWAPHTQTETPSAGARGLARCLPAWQRPYRADAGFLVYIPGVLLGLEMPPWAALAEMDEPGSSHQLTKGLGRAGGRWLLLQWKGLKPHWFFLFYSFHFLFAPQRGMWTQIYREFRIREGFYSFCPLSHRKCFLKCEAEI